MKFIYRLWAVLLASGIAGGAFAQTQISGKVVDAVNNEPIIGASIYVTEEKSGALSDADGNFSLNVKELPATLKVNFVGYREEQIDVYDNSEAIVIELIDASDVLQELVVVGYGTQKRKELTGSIASVGKESLNQITTSFDNLLGGAVSGLNVSQSSGMPGASSNLRIRGGNSINGGNEPLYVIDGILIYNDNSSTSTGIMRATSDFNPLAAINPSDIESIEVLKDVSAAAIYGSRGANGVIIVTTKNGKKGKTNIEYQYSLGWQTVSKKLDLMRADDWGRLYLELATADQLSSSGLTEEIVSTWGAGDDWQDAALRTATTQNHQLSISGGDEKTRYLISGNFSDQDGIVINTGFKRYAGRIKLERDLFKNFTVGVNVTASKAIQKGYTDFSQFLSYTGGNENTIEYVLRTPRAVSIYNEDGSYNYSNPYEVGDLRVGDQTPNAIADLTEVTSETKTNNLLGSAFAQWHIIPGLTLKLSASTNLVNTTQNYYAPSTSSAGITVGGYGTVGNKRSDNYQYEATLTWDKKIGVHSFNIMGGYTSQVTNIEYSIATAENFSNETLGYHSLQSGSLLVSPETGGTKSTLHSALARVNYTLLGRYNLTATLRADGSSRFAPNNRWGWFPSLGFAWNVDEESFLKGKTIIDDLKLRASIGTVGNQEIDDYTFLSTYETVRYYFGSTATVGYARSSLENPDLKWETTTQYNVGFDLSILKKRLNFTFDYYTKKTSDLLLEIPVEQTTGFSSQLQNVGNVKNSGVEFAVDASLIKTKDLSWNLSANIAHNKNEVTNLGSLDSIINTYTIVKVGESLGSFYGWKFDGVVQLDEDLSTIPSPSTKPEVEYGDAKFVDQNGDGEIDQENDRVVLGSIQPDFTYGFSTTLNYKRWSLFASFQGSQGNDVYNSLRQRLESPSTSYNVSAKLVNRWTETNPSNTIPKAYATNNYTNYLDSRYVEDASYLRLKNITLSYTLPIRISATQNVRLRLFVSGQNLLTFTNYEGYDPEVASGIDSGAYPTARTYTIGVNISY